MASSWKDELEWFKKQYGGNEDIAKKAYAAEIASKEKSGSTFSNQAAADQFKIDNPNFFGGQTVKPNNNNSYRPSRDDYASQAQTYADININPQIEALQRALSTAGVNAENQKRAIEAAYSGLPQVLDESAEKARKNALTSAISRGVSRSGVVDWQNAEIEKEKQKQLSHAEAQKAAQLIGIDSTLANFQQNTQGQLSSLAANKGNLQQMYLDTLLNKDLDRQFSYDQFDWQKSQADIGNQFNREQLGWQQEQAQRNYELATRKQDSAEEAEMWQREYLKANKASQGAPSSSQADDTGKLDRSAREFAIKLATVDGFFDEKEYNKIYKKLINKNAFDDPYVQQLLQMFNPMNFLSPRGTERKRNDGSNLIKSGLIE